MIFPSTPHNGIIITVVGILVSAPFFIWGFVLYKKQQRKEEVKLEPTNNKNDLKRAIAKAKITSEELIQYIHHIKKLGEGGINQEIIDTYYQKVGAYQDSINCMEIERIAAGSEMAEIVKPLLIWFPLCIATLRIGEGINYNNLNGFERIILETIDKLNEL